MSTIDALLLDAYTHWDDPALLSRVGCELQTRARFHLARPILRRAVELNPQDVDAWANLSYTHFRALEDEQGREVLREGIARSGSDALKSNLAGFSDAEEAERWRTEIKDSHVPSVEAGVWSQRFREGEHEAALDALRTLAEAHPDDKGVREAYLWTLMGARRQGLVEGLDLREEGLPLVARLIEEDPDALEDRWLQLMMLQAEKDWDGLLEKTAQTLERFPDEETVMQFRGQAYREKGDEDHAMQWFLRAIGAKPSFVGARIDLGKLYEKQGRLELAEEVFREIPKANPDYKAGAMSLALFLTRQGRLEEAEAVFLEAWPQVPAMFQGFLRGNPEAKPLLERDAVKALVEGAGGASA